MKKKSVYYVFWLLIGLFVLIISSFFISFIRGVIRGELFLFIWLLIFVLGGVLLILLKKEKIEKRLKKFFFLTGICAVGFFVGGVLHNIFYALAIVTINILVLHYLMEALHVSFFILSVFVCPLGFLIGAIASIVVLLKSKKLFT